MKPYQAVLLDRDGVILKLVDHLHNVEDVELLDGAADVIRQIGERGIPILVITNQSVIGRGLIDREGLRQIHERMGNLLADEGAKVDAVFYCPHTPEDDCFCRKPKPGLLYAAALKYKLDLRECILIGDQQSDMEAAIAANCPHKRVPTHIGLAFWERLGSFKKEFNE
jgi:histidinol-phosphate phosphatase family protein